MVSVKTTSKLVFDDKLDGSLLEELKHQHRRWSMNTSGYFLEGTCTHKTACLCACLCLCVHASTIFAVPEKIHKIQSGKQAFFHFMTWLCWIQSSVCFQDYLICFNFCQQKFLNGDFWSPGIPSVFVFGFCRVSFFLFLFWHLQGSLFHLEKLPSAQKVYFTVV